MPDASPTPQSPPPPPAPTSSKSRIEPESMRDRLSAAARQRAARPKALVWIYAALGLAVLVILVGQLAGWWPSPVENRIRANHRPADASKPTPPSPPPSPSDAPMSDAPMSGTEDSK